MNIKKDLLIFFSIILIYFIFCILAVGMLERDISKEGGIGAIAGHVVRDFNQAREGKK